MAAPVGLLRVPADGAAVPPAVRCAAAGHGHGGFTYPVPPANRSSTFPAGRLSVTVARGGADSLSWTSTGPVAAVLVRSGDAVQAWPSGGANSGAGLEPPGDGTRLAPSDDVTFCLPGPAEPPPPAPLPLRLEVVAQGTFTRSPQAVRVRGMVTIENPNPGSTPIAGLAVAPSTLGSCSLPTPLEVPSGRTDVEFRCDVDIADAARQATVAVTATSPSAPGAATSTVLWQEAAH